MMNVNSQIVNVGGKIVKTLGEGDNLCYQIIQKNGDDVATRTVDYLGKVIKDTLELKGRKIGNKTFNSVKVVEDKNTTITEEIFNGAEYLGKRITKIEGDKKTVEKMNKDGNGYFKEFIKGIVTKKGIIKNGFYQSLQDTYGRMRYIKYNNKGLPIPTEASRDFDKNERVFANMSLQEMLKYAKEHWQGYFRGMFYTKNSGLENIAIDYSRFDPIKYANKLDLFNNI